MSSFTKKLNITQIGKRLWRVDEAFDYHVGYKGSDDVIHIPKGFITDLASIPRIFWTIVGHPLGEYAQAAVVHDYLYNQQKRSRKECDAIFYEAMGVLRVAKWKRIVMYRAVKWFGWWAWNKQRRKLKKAGYFKNKGE